MEITPDESAVLARFHDKARIAGGTRPGYMLRKQAVVTIQPSHPDLDLTGGLESLIGKELLKVNEGGNLYYLTEAGAEKVAELFGG